MSDEIILTAKKVMAAVKPEDVFGAKATSDDVRKIKKRLSRLLHPDFVPTPLTTVAAPAFIRLNELVAEAERRFGAGIYGKSGVSPSAKPVGPVVITSKRHQYVITENVASGDMCNIYHCVFSTNGRAILKIARDPADNEAVKKEAKILKLLRADKKDGAEKFHQFVPELFDSLVVQTPTNRVQANVLRTPEGLFPLEAVMEQYLNGVDPKDVVWMWRRLLVAIRFAHVNGVVHGAVIPSHVLILPAEHGAVLIDWCYATQEDERITAVSAKYEDLYPPEVFAKEKPTPATDIFMAAKCIDKLLGKQDVPKTLRGLLASCLLKNPSRRPQDAWTLHQEIGVVIDKLWPRKFRPFTMSLTNQ